MQRIAVIDSHTGGEPTRVVVAGAPDLGVGSMADLRARFRDQHDTFRSTIVNEPRGSDVLVGALLLPPSLPDCCAGVVFFNNVGVLHMCGHGTIGLGVTLGHLGRIGAGVHHLDTSVGVIKMEYDGAHTVALENVPSYRSRAKVAVEVDGVGTVVGDIAWGGNWFFLVEKHPWTLALTNVEQLTDGAWRIRQALERDGIAGADGQPIDHIELFGPPTSPNADSRNFVLCPGKAYDRSPCGTGTSAKLACLAADGKLAPGSVWRQESITGSLFEGFYREANGQILPTVRGQAYITAESHLLVDPADPLKTGLRT